MTTILQPSPICQNPRGGGKTKSFFFDMKGKSALMDGNTLPFEKLSPAPPR
jgi:hypothetical protein